VLHTITQPRHSLLLTFKSQTPSHKHHSQNGPAGLVALVAGL
jgi:hypothetical protein